MNSIEKKFLSVLFILFFFVLGGVACTYTPASGVNLVWVEALGLLLFIGVGYVACSRKARASI